MRLIMILPLLAVLGLAACESTPDEDASTTGGGAEDAIVEMPDASADRRRPWNRWSRSKSTSPFEPPIGSQTYLVQNVGDRVFFELDSAVLGTDSRQTLERQAGWLRLVPDVSLVIEGHCDERGTREYNLALGERRANVVREYLISQGIAPSRLRTISYGKERPYALGHNDEAWALNRRSVSAVE